MRAYFAEFIATLLFVFLGAGTVVVTGEILGEELTAARLVAIALAHGFAITLLVTATAKISGGHLNPAVTFAAWVTKKISLAVGIGYVLAQLLGGVLGALLLKAALPFFAEGNLGAHGLGAGVQISEGLLVEIILTFGLVLVVFLTALDPKTSSTLAPAAIGLAVLVDHLFGVPITGASMNPARSFGPALVAGIWANHWIYWVGPILGALLAALVWKFFLTEKENRKSL